MAPGNEKDFVDFIKLVSPGTPLRNVINDLIRANLGATIVFDCEDLAKQKIIEGGFKLNSKFTSQKLFEICKMDGATIVSPDLKRILFANTLLNPDITIPSIETGTRHKSAERTAKQVNTFIITVSERRKKTTLYYGPYRYILKTTEELRRNVSSTLQVLEKQREIFSENVSTLNILEMTELASVGDVCNVIQRAEIILRISESVKRDFTELGQEGNIMHMRYRELLRGIEKTEQDILRDYAPLDLKKSKEILNDITFNELLDTETIAKLIIGKPLDENILPKGVRFLKHLTIKSEDIETIASQFENLKEILSADEAELELVFASQADVIKEEIQNLREQILSRKVVY